MPQGKQQLAPEYDFRADGDILTDKDYVIMCEWFNTLKRRQ